MPLTVDAQQARTIAAEAYIFLYPLVLMDITRRVMTNGGAELMHAPHNALVHVPAYPTAEMREVVRPNFDTLYSTGWLDLRNEPVIVSAPDTKGRYYLLPMLDMWSDVFAAPGARTTGTAAYDFAVVGPGWKGELPPEIDHIDAPTPFVWLLGRTQTNGPADYAAVHAVQKGYRVTPLSQWGQSPSPPLPQTSPDVDMTTEPLRQVSAMRADRFFAYGAELMSVNPPHRTDWSQLARMKAIGINRDLPFDIEQFESSMRTAIDQGVADARERMHADEDNLGIQVNGWGMLTDTMGVYGNAYMRRALIAMGGLGANQPEDAIYPPHVAEDGRRLTGDRRYVIHFSADKLPPANAFWSITMYDRQGYQVANPLNRFAIGDRDALTYNDDGSLDIFIQHDDPGVDRTSNWLPSPPADELRITMRLYAPREEALDGRWVPPVVQVRN
ncbi:DUF1254 domain-containing protein [Novosphingobium sp. BL-8H]|uniref:DUF1254 domain-containing protein n=1 Tax=Novosphingobium sp. BL-8H TaxID=3127640 RepID=UPI0037565078